jgi:hypothetical protein
MLIQHQQTEQQGVFFCLDHEGNKIAELTYYFVDEKTINANHTYVTNRRVIQKSRSSIFANSTNIIELRRIEDVSFHQNSLIDHLCRFGTLRMSTVGDETTYTLKYVDTRHDEVKTISHLVYECNKNTDDTLAK